MQDNQDEQLVHSLEIWFASGADPNACYRAFEAYGYAMTAASSFELLMALLASKTIIFRLGRRSGSREPIDEPQIRQQMLTYSYARLLRWLRRLHVISPELQEGLEFGKVARDRLAHDFWQTHAADLFSVEGVDVIATNCIVAVDYFTRLANSLVQELKVDPAEFVEMLQADPEREQRLAGWHGIFVEQGLR